MNESSILEVRITKRDKFDLYIFVQVREKDNSHVAFTLLFSVFFAVPRIIQRLKSMYL